MAVAFDLNRTLEPNVPEAKEVQHPPGYSKGAFPRETLGRNEKIYWEGKPSLTSYLVSPILLAIAYVFYEIVFNVPYLSNEYFGNLIGYQMLIEFIPILAFFIVRIIKWYRTSFAITNRRVLTKYGVFTTVFCDCYHDKIQNSVIIERFWQWILGYGTLLFATSGNAGGIVVGTKAKMKNGGGIYWVGVPHPYEIKRYCEDIINYSMNRTKKADAERLALAIKGDGLQGPALVDALGEDAVGPTKDSNRNIQGPASVEEKIASLNRLKDDGVISWDDYERMRKKVVGAQQEG